MKRRRLLLILLGSVASITLAILLWPREREPEYKGLPLSTWLMRYRDDAPQAIEAIRHIGTNALPYLVRWIQYERPAWRNSLFHLHSKLPSSMQKLGIFHWMINDQAEFRADLAVEAFSTLGPKANPATDELLRLALAENSRAPNAQRRATFCLMNMNATLRPGDFDRDGR